ncbi:hypothetical protein [Rhodovulum marinum]|uniref:hypothetical protein n=1 Tax=Rhodovulum marinum TaxID=320662 RepID=UPI00104776AE|nr:hypothetical protein [Rhodovulum marinum]
MRAKEQRETAPDPADRRRVRVRATDRVQRLFKAMAPAAHGITAENLPPLSPENRAVFLPLLEKLG